VQLGGHFNPLIFQPSWFAREGLISEEARDAAELRMVHPQVVDFSLGWVSLQVTQDTFLALVSSSAEYDRLRDLLYGAFGILRHTPVTSAILGWSRHYRYETQEAAEAVVRRLGLTSTATEVVPGAVVQSLQLSAPIFNSTSEAPKPATRGVIIEPSRVLPPGVYTNVFDQFGFVEGSADNSKQVADADGLLECLDRTWRESIDAADELSERMISAAEQTLAD
jgi:hypothetical protein